MTGTLRPVSDGPAARPASAHLLGTEHARLPTRHQQALLAGLTSVTSALLRGLPIPEVLGLIAGCAQRSTPARLVLITTTTAQGDLLVEAAAGVGAERLTGSETRPALDSPAPAPGAGPAPGALRTVLPHAGDHGYALTLPLGHDRSDHPRALLLIADTHGALEHDDLALAEFASQVATSLTLAEQRQQADQDAALLERDALAGALLDQLLLPLHQVILQLSSADGLISDESTAARARVRQGVAALDEIISRTRRVVGTPHPLPSNTATG